MEITKTIDKFRELQEEKDRVENVMEQHFDAIADKMIDEGHTYEECAEAMRPMPECCSKVLIFRKLLMTFKKVDYIGMEKD